MAGIYGMNVTDVARKVAKRTLCGEYACSSFNFTDEENVSCEFYIPKDSYSIFTDVWSMFVNALPLDSARYAIVDVEYMSPTDKIIRCKRIFVLWAPKDTSRREKMLSTMHLKDVKRQLVKQASVILIQANTYEDLDYKTILKTIKHKTTIF